MKITPWLVESAFGLNDWFVLSCIALSYIIICILPRRFPSSVTFLLLLFSATAASMLDNSLGGHIFDLYDIMDGPAYTLMDFLVYFLYGPMGYFFIYIYDRLQLRGMKTVGYILLWSGFSVVFELLCSCFGVFHYKDSYNWYYSFCIYLASQSALKLFYRFISGARTGVVTR